MNPPNKFTSLGRCNDKGVSLLYAANRFSTAIFEVKPRVGDYVTVGAFKGLTIFESEPKLRLHVVGSRYLSEITDLKKPFKNFQYDPAQSKYDDVLDRLFHQDDLDNNSIYKVSTAITEIYLTDTIDSEANLLSTQGIIYSSILRRKHFCYLLSPEFARKVFWLSSLQTFKILYICDDYIDVEFLREAKFYNNSVYNNLKLVFWKDVHPQKERISTLEF